MFQNMSRLIFGVFKTKFMLNIRKKEIGSVSVSVVKAKPSRLPQQFNWLQMAFSLVNNF